MSRLSWLLGRSLAFTLEMEGGLSCSERHLLMLEGTDCQVGKGLRQAAEREEGPVPVFPGKKGVMTLGMKPGLGRKRYRDDFPLPKSRRKIKRSSAGAAIFLVGTPQEAFPAAIPGF